MDGLQMKYFVLKPRSKQPGDVYAEASRKAMRAYANHIQGINPAFAEDLRRWANDEFTRMLEMEQRAGFLGELDMDMEVED